MSDAKERYVVVINEEEQYSVWPEEAAIPLGWRAVGVARAKDECLAEIERLWTDMRPKSLKDAERTKH